MNTMVRKSIEERMYNVTVIRDKNDRNGNPIYRVNVYDSTGVNLNDQATLLLGLKENNFGLRVQSYDIANSVDNIVKTIDLHM